MDYLDFRGSSEYSRKESLSGTTELLVLVAENRSRAESIRETEGDFLARSSTAPENGRHHALCP